MRHVPTLEFVADALPEIGPPPRRGAGQGPRGSTRRSPPGAARRTPASEDPYKKPRSRRATRPTSRRTDDDDRRARPTRPSPTRMPEPGLVVVDKPAGITSHDVVARVRRLAGTRKVGHAGTLDPMATGVLVLGVDRATRLLGHLMLTDKAYDATVRLGVATTTDDAEGEVRRDRPRPARLTEATVRAAPRRSSPATCSRCRPRSPRSRSTASAPTSGSATASRSSSTAATGHRARAGGPRRPARDEPTSSTSTSRCAAPAAPTCARSPATPAPALGVGGHLTALRRTAVGPYDLDRARTLDQLADSFAVLPDRRRRPRGVPCVDLDRGRRRRRARGPSARARPDRR